jgi:hypothetical protein
MPYVASVMTDEASVTPHVASVTADEASVTPFVASVTADEASDRAVETLSRDRLYRVKLILMLGRSMNILQTGQ